MNSIFKDQILEQLEALPLNSQKRVLDFAKALAVSAPKGVKGKALLRFAGKISEDDLNQMSETIESDCEI